MVCPGVSLFMYLILRVLHVERLKKGKFPGPPKQANREKSCIKGKFPLLFFRLFSQFCGPAFGHILRIGTRSKVTYQPGDSAGNWLKSGFPGPGGPEIAANCQKVGESG